VAPRWGGRPDPAASDRKAAATGRRPPSLTRYGCRQRSRCEPTAQFLNFRGLSAARRLRPSRRSAGRVDQLSMVPHSTSTSPAMARRRRRRCR
jgi:hypothetical protein